jgi:broad specificity phosphatase PhoE
MSPVHFITHPEVAIDPSVPISDWPLSAAGVRRMALLVERPWIRSIETIFSSAERKAVDAARMIADRLSLSPIIVAALGENDRTSTGYLPKQEFEAVADTFFARPNDSARGWERAADAQRRIVNAVDAVLATAPTRQNVAIVSHGAVGTLLLCHLKQVPISRCEDQPGEGGGNVFSFDAAARRLIHGWRRFEDM